MGDTLGRIFGTGLDEICFIYDSIQKDETPTPVELGQILIAEHEKVKEKFLIRVADITYGQNAEWSKIVARGYNSQEEHDLEDEHEKPDEIFQPDDRDQLYLIASCEMLGYINPREEFTTPKKLPLYFSKVRKLKEKDVKIKSLENKFGDMHIGKLRSGEDDINIPAGLYEEYIPYHIGMFAATGRGKSNAGKVYISKVVETKGRVAVLAFDPHGEYSRELKKHPLSDRIEIYDQNGERGNKKIRIAYEDITVSVLMNFKFQLGLTEPQERMMKEAESRFKGRWIQVIVENPVTEEEDEGQASAIILSRVFRNFHEGTIRAVQSKLQSIAQAPYIVRDKNVSNIKEIIQYLHQGKTVIVDTQSLAGMLELTLSSVLTSKVFSKHKWLENHKKKYFDTEIPRVSIMIEEAQRVLGKGTHADHSVFAKICNEGRKFKVGLFVIAQQPKNIDNDLLSQINTFIILGISNKNDFNALDENAKKPLDQLRTEIRSLRVGEAIVTCPLSPFAMPIKIELWEDCLKEAQKCFMNEKDEIAELNAASFSHFA